VGRTTSKIGSKLPWWIKIALKLVFARLPLGYRVWRFLGVFKPGRMLDPEYAYATVSKHFSHAIRPKDPIDFTVLELGPGDSLFSAPIANIYGAKTVFLVDEGAYAVQSMESFHDITSYLSEKGHNLEHVDNTSTCEEFLRACGAKYLCNGLESLRSIPSQSVDFIWSHSVLQHVRKRVFKASMAELRRLLRPGGVCSHHVDLKDCLGGSLNNLRFPERFWEWDLIASSGFYTNRLRFSELLELISQVGFKTEVLRIEYWDQPPLANHKLSRSFRHISSEELLISGCDFIARPV